jgi:hypothetical protein
MKNWIGLLCVLLLSMFVVAKAEAQVVTSCQRIIGQDQPAGLALDNVHNTVWVAFFQQAYVLEIAQDCSIVRQVATGLHPDGVAFDGTNVWVAR